MKDRAACLEYLGITEAMLVHYDIRRTNARSRTALNRFLSGRTEVRTAKTYRYPGLVAEGAEWIGQSVFVLDPPLADRLIKRLQELRIRYRARTIYVEA